MPRREWIRSSLSAGRSRCRSSQCQSGVGQKARKRCREEPSTPIWKGWKQCRLPCQAHLRQGPTMIAFRAAQVGVWR
jgi:hypothetical protein